MAQAVDDDAAPTSWRNSGAGRNIVLGNVRPGRAPGAVYEKAIEGVTQAAAGRSLKVGPGLVEVVRKTRECAARKRRCAAPDVCPISIAFGTEEPNNIDIIDFLALRSVLPPSLPPRTQWAIIVLR